MTPTLKTAIQAAKEAGKIHRKFYGKVRNIRFKSPGKLNLVTEVDQRCERLILGILRKRFPSHNLWGEESGPGRKASEYTWFVDPLDGTTNYAHAYPFFCVSIALVKNAIPDPNAVVGARHALPLPKPDILCGVVYDALRDECFTAEKGRGAHLNGKRMKVSATGTLAESLVCTGFAYAVRETKYNLENFRTFVLKAQGVRRDGSAALNLAYTAAGRFDGFWERGLQAWDMAAGTLMVREAGGKLTDLNGGAFDLMRENALATNGKIHSAMFRLLRSGRDEERWKRLRGSRV